MHVCAMALLDADTAATTSTYTLYDHDPREDNEPGEESGEYESDSGRDESEGGEAAGTPQDYFGPQHGHGETLDEVDEDRP